MGVRISVFLSHDLADPGDSAETLGRLAPCLPSSLIVSDFWKARGEGLHDVDRWAVNPEGARIPHLRRYDGPGSLFLKVTPNAAELYTGARWRGFLTIEPLRLIHLAAFRAVARALGSNELVICADSNDSAAERFLENGTQADCTACLSGAGRN